MLPLFSLLLLAPLTVIAHRIQHFPRQQQSDSCTAVPNVHLSNYGFPDASGLTQYSCNGDQQVSGNVPTPLGDGSAEKPYSAALSDTATAFKKCETVYIPYFRKYFKFTDICAQCQTDQASSKLHIDLYLVQSDANIGQTPCELSFGVFDDKEFTVLRNPPSTLPYSGTPLFDNGQCNTGAVFADGANDAGACSGSGSGGGDSGSANAQVIAPTSQVDGLYPVQTPTASAAPVIGTAPAVNTYTSNLVLQSSGTPYVPIATAAAGNGSGNGGSSTGTLAGSPGQPSGMPAGGWHHHHGAPPKMRRVKR